MELTEKQILQGNTIIADFFAEKREHLGSSFYYKHGVVYSGFGIHDAKYHSSWDWLMPVVEKIENLEDGEYMFEICGRRSTISIMVNHNRYDNVIITEFHTGNSNSKIEAVWLSIVEFIKEYNKIKNG